VAYYQGDYYQGDYYQGDPFLGSLFAKGLGWLGKKIFKRKLNPVGMEALERASASGLRRAAPYAAAGAVALAPSIPIPFTKMQVTPSAFFPGGRPFVGPRRPQQPLNLTMGVGPSGACCPSGFHMAKDGSGRCVRNRSMNVANPRALRRSLRRVAGFGKLAQRAKKDIRRASKAIGA